jgi:hypothetical protein
MIFIDLNKAYDRVDRQALWEDMAGKLNMPAEIIQVIRNMYIANKGQVCIDGDQASSFKANIGVK